ncbi:tripartite tricarboxylate transporter permease [Aliiruegeria lutimaris]|uniref:TctA family transporter n=1 Tax=Aliiruegeria lutimaris TaxID=571298 RepID=A0A1G8KXL5_9RHOB|nr:tripartite tricarboxylate transporter permease [Aliiruegeria lutimaris]SDI47640.1 TctA family transporter [Aliiruegeria lutimaris]
MLSDVLLTVLAPSNLIIIAAATFYGCFVGAVPGLTATMAVALLVPFTFFLDPIPAISAIVATTTTAIFAGDISGTLLRIPGTPASAAYVDDAHALSQAGKARTSLFVSLITAAIGGVIGVIILMLVAPQLARIAISFSSFETFWLACLGLTCAIFVGGGTVPKSFASLCIGLAIACVGIDVAVGHPRYTFGTFDLLDGISFIPAMIGIFAFSEVLRNVQILDKPAETIIHATEKVGAAMKAALAVVFKYPKTVGGSSVLGTLVGALPGAGADIAAWISYALTRRFSKDPEKFGKGSLEGVAAGGSANNAAIGGAWTPALVFGIPGDSVTAIAIGVLLLKGLTPGPRIFVDQPELTSALFGSFLVANIMMVPVGILAILASTFILKVPRAVMAPVILLFSMVGAFAIAGTVTAIWIVLALGLMGYYMEKVGIPLAPAILGIVLGKIIEDNFMVSMIKAQGDLSAFFDRQYSMVLGIITLGLWGLLVLRSIREISRSKPQTEG